MASRGHCRRDLYPTPAAHRAASQQSCCTKYSKQELGCSTNGRMRQARQHHDNNSRSSSFLYVHVGKTAGASVGQFLAAGCGCDADPFGNTRTDRKRHPWRYCPKHCDFQWKHLWPLQVQDLIPLCTRRATGAARCAVTLRDPAARVASAFTFLNPHVHGQALVDRRLWNHTAVGERERSRLQRLYSCFERVDDFVRAIDADESSCGHIARTSLMQPVGHIGRGYNYYFNATVHLLPSLRLYKLRSDASSLSRDAGCVFSRWYPGVIPPVLPHDPHHDRHDSSSSSSSGTKKASTPVDRSASTYLSTEARRLLENSEWMAEEWKIYRLLGQHTTDCARSSPDTAHALALSES